jgi:hypothetical protein
MRVISLLSSAAAIKVITDGKGECSAANGHPENGGYYVTGFGSKRDAEGNRVMAHDDPDDPSTYGENWGLTADDYTWSTGYSYANAMPVSCTVMPAYDMYCVDITELYNFATKSTCAIMRFSFDDDSSVWVMTGNESFQACDFTGAEEIPLTGTLASGSKYVDFPLEQDMIDNQYYIASKSGCAEGQKVAIAVGHEYAETYNTCYNMGEEANRVQHCDCDHKVKTGTLNDVCGAGYFDGCMSEMPEELDCCPGNDLEFVRVGWGGNYVKGGACIPKSKMRQKMQNAKEVYEKCTDAANKAECDGYLEGSTCPWWRIYDMGGWVYNTAEDGTAACDCEDPGQCTIAEEDCTGCQEQQYPQVAYGGDGKKMPDLPEYTGCDGATTSYNPHCLTWFYIAHCKAIEEGKDPTEGYSGAALEKIQTLNKDECDGSQDVYAYKKYSEDPTYWSDWLTGVMDQDDSFSALPAMGLLLALRA